MELKWIKIFTPAVLEEPNFIRLVEAESRKFCIVKNENEIFAVQSKCPHAGADLSLGFCKDQKLICSYHRYEYDLHTGKGSPGQGDYINTYPIEIRADGVYIGLKEKWTFFKKLKRIW